MVAVSTPPMPKPSLRPALAWPLVGTLALSAWALWWPKQDVPLARQTNRAEMLATAGPRRASDIASAPAVSASPGTSNAYPSIRPPLSLATADPFALPAPAPVTASVPPLPAEPQPARTQEPTPAVASAPTMNYRFFGRFREPGGRWLVFVSDASVDGGGTPLALSAGMTLPPGWVVQSLGDADLHLNWPATGTKVVLPLPPSDEDAP